MDQMRQKASHYAILLIHKGFAAKSHNFIHELRGFPRRPRTEFGCIHEGKDAMRLFHEMLSMSTQPSVSVYNNLLSIVTKMKEYSVALTLFDKMRQLGVPVNEYTMNIVINYWCLLNRVDLAFAILGSFLKQGYKPSVSTFNTLLKGLYSVGKVAEAESLFKKVLTFKLCEPNDIMILTVINGLCKAGQTCTAHDLLLELEKKRCKANVKAYSAVIDGLSKDGMVDDALLLLTKMSDKHIVPDIATYNSIIGGLCVVRRWNEAKCLLLIDMIDHKISPNVITFSILVEAFCKEGKMKNAEDLLELMIHLNVCPNIITYGAMIDGYCLHGQLRKAKEIFDSIPKRVFLGILSLPTIV